MFASCLNDILLMFRNFCSFILNLNIVQGVSIGSLIIASTIFNLVLNLIRPALSGASSAVRKFDYSRGVSEDQQFEKDVAKAKYNRKVKAASYK